MCSHRQLPNAMSRLSSVRNRALITASATFGHPEQLQRSLVYPISLVLKHFFLGKDAYRWPMLGSRPAIGLENFQLPSHLLLSSQPRRQISQAPPRPDRAHGDG